jgi:argininosuccinate synthase
MPFKEIAEENVGVCVSGGLSSLTVAASLAESGVRTTAFVADIGQAGRDELLSLARSLESAGLPTVMVDLRDSMAALALDIVRYDARYDGGYWNTTSGSRLVLSRGLAEAISGAGCTVLAHGCVGGGNDERRFQRYGAAFAAHLRVFSPWADADMRSWFPDRGTMETYVRGLGLVLDPRCGADYSVDGNLAGFAHEGAALEALGTADGAARRVLTVSPQQAPDKAETVTVRFDHGQPLEIDGVPGEAHELLERANSLAGRHGVGLRSVVENRINGTKCRGVYESPGLDLLGFGLTRVYQVAMNNDARQLMQSLSVIIGHAVYEGRYFDPAVRAARAAADILVDSASATVEVEIFKGGMSMRSLSSQNPERMPPRQTRFISGGGHFWRVAT